MNAPDSPTATQGFRARLLNAGINPSDSEQEKLNKTLLVFATGLVSFAAMVWLALYRALGPQVPSTWPFLFELAFVGNLFLYIWRGNFAFFRMTQLSLFLFVPFAVQWSIGNFIVASGVILWGLLAPIGAILCVGIQESAAWFIAWVFMTGLSGAFDFILIGGHQPGHQPMVPIETSMVFFALNFISVATIIYALLRFSIQEKQRFQKELETSNGLLRAEQERSERLLLNVLPVSVAERLKNSEDPIVDGFRNATVMFADIVDFTRIAGEMPPNDVFGILNRVFSAFDDLTERYGLEKIKTIGDCYMVAGGLHPEGSSQAEAMADLALAILQVLHHDPATNPAALNMRIGIASGPLVAGVVGKNKFIYDLWGDTVNVASRITTECAPGGIQCDAITYEALRSNFEFGPAHDVDLKGKGVRRLHPLLRRRPAAPLEV